jgi:hypothetical protein
VYTLSVSVDITSTITILSKVTGISSDNSIDSSSICSVQLHCTTMDSWDLYNAAYLLFVCWMGKIRCMFSVNLLYILFGSICTKSSQYSEHVNHK